MTRKEAIHVLEQERAYLMGGPMPQLHDYDQALEMAIASLGDHLVPLADVIHALEKLRTLEQAQNEGRLVMHPRKPYTPPKMEIIKLR